MKIKSLIKALEDFSGPALAQDFEITGISCNSRGVKPGGLFVAVKGAKEDGNKYIAEALNNGAKAVILEGTEYQEPSTEKVIFIKVADTRKALARLAAVFYGYPAKEMKFIGITGTNGKTTISYLIEAILKAANFHPGVIGTVSYRFKDKEIPAKNTTPGPLELQELFSEMHKAGVDYVVMEVSSHALSQGRTEGVDFQSAIFTNLTQDHLDYHVSMEGYFQAKRRLFLNAHPDALKIINNDDAFGKRLKTECSGKVVTYGIENNSDYMAKDLKLHGNGTEFDFIFPGGKYKLKTPLIGKHNVLNILAALAWADRQDLKLQGLRVIEKFATVPGRLERVNCKKDFAVYVDYAHTDDALKNVILSLRQIASGKLIVVFGCGGDRDKTKRPKMGKVVTELSDYAIITSDNPRCEDPNQIIKEIEAGIVKDNYSIVPERGQAIKKALQLAKAGDVVLIAGKGHEDYQVFKAKTIHFDDREVALQCLDAMN